MPEINVEFVKAALKNEVWDLGNQVLYDLCAKYPNHQKEDVILAKVWLIGRSYAAAIERRRKHLDSTNDHFYDCRSKISGFRLRRVAKETN